MAHKLARTRWFGVYQAKLLENQDRPGLKIRMVIEVVRTAPNRAVQSGISLNREIRTSLMSESAPSPLIIQEIGHEKLICFSHLSSLRSTQIPLINPHFNKKMLYPNYFEGNCTLYLSFSLFFSLLRPKINKKLRKW